MATLVNSLAEITNKYTIFEKDQVLTESQLNGLSSYLDDQDRLNRINLVGVGLLCGLHVNFSQDQVVITKGLGITTDGDLMRIPANTSYDRFKLYDESFPTYPPLYTSPTSMLTVYELVERGVVDTSASAIDEFETQTESQFADMVVVLLMESYIKDHDLCSGTDCDNHSQVYITQLKPLLVAKGDISALTPSIQTAAHAALALNPLMVDRVHLSATIRNFSQFAQEYRTASSNMHHRLITELPNLWGQAGFLLAEHFTSDPIPGWVTQLGRWHNQFATSDSHIQYYYDFLKDLTETWNTILDALFSETTWCCPDINGFAKHLLLGDLIPGEIVDANRLEFYPSAATNRQDTTDRAVFLVKKMGLLINHFNVSLATRVEVTPSYSSATNIEQRAIPSYYTVDDALLHHWNFSLSQRHRERYNYSYHHHRYGALGAAADPLEFAIDGNNFFRIEGHVGQSASSVISTIENQIEQYNLPFTVIGILLGSENRHLIGPRGAGYTDLNRLHSIVRKDLYYRLDDVTQFSNNYRSRINQAISQGVVRDDVEGNTSSSVSTIAANRDAMVSQRATAAKQKLNVNYATYINDSSWKDDVNNVVVSASQFKFELGKVSKTEFVTPFDGLITDSKSDWLNWLDILIQDKDQKTDEKKQFRHFINHYPGVDHTAGVIRGGTFIVLYDTSGTVVGDLMLSHYYQENLEEEVNEPPLLRPELPRDWDFGVQINPSWDNLLQDRLADFKINIDTEWQTKFDVGTYYADIFRDTIGVVTANPDLGVTTPGITGRYGDSVLGRYAGGVDTQVGRLDEIDRALLDAGLSADEQTFLRNQKAATEQELGRTMEAMAEYMSVRGTGTTAGTDGALAIQLLGRGMTAIGNNSHVREQTVGQLTNLQNRTNNAGLASGLNVLLRR